MQYEIYYKCRGNIEEWELIEIGHVLRKEEADIVRVVNGIYVERTRKIGRRKMKWDDVIENDIRLPYKRGE